jgi:hypothetical protein
MRPAPSSEFAASQPTSRGIEVIGEGLPLPRPELHFFLTGGGFGGQ